MLTGWFMLKAEWPSPIPLLNIKKDMTSIFTLEYNMVSSEISFVFKSHTDIKNPSSVLD